MTAPGVSRDAAVERLLLIREIEEFLYAEADLLDARKFTDWLELFTQDVRYWMPMRRNVKYGEWERETTRPEEVAWFDEDRTTLGQRVQQLQTGIHWAEEPVSRVCHVVSAVQLKELRGEEADVTSRFLVYRNRLETETDLFVGRREDTLHRAGGSWKIARRTILLDQNVLMAKNLTVFF